MRSANINQSIDLFAVCAAFALMTAIIVGAW